jgi:GTP diphosphokinase / guanosine-3',5'-bis(diphosphate) 3'-diphosphatase
MDTKNNIQANDYVKIEDLFFACDYITNKFEIEIISRAYNVSQKYHEGQKRKSGEPYFNHCVHTAINIAKQKMDYETICAGLLHDTLEDTLYTNEEMQRDFGPVITNLVEGVTKLGKVRYSGAERHVESLRKFLIAMSDDMRVVVVKLCDRLHNINTLEFVDVDKRKRIALETLEIHARLADRLGMGRLKAELEDGSFPFVYPAEYSKTKLLISEYKANEEVLIDVVNKLKEELKVFEVNIERVDHRVKHLYSLWQKMEKYNYDINKIHDIFALRIIVPSMSDCYQALGVVHGLYKPKPGRFKDYIAVPKPNGYQSLHTSIFTGNGDSLEIQIRTKQMHEEAEYGIASHLFYKEIGKNLSKDKIKSKTNWTKDLLDWQKDISKHDVFLKHLKEDFFNHRVFVFTPKGDVIDLPLGSTPIDFAYQIHSDIGDHALRAYANDKLVSFEYEIKNKDIIRIEVSDKVRPNRKWITTCKTQFAKRHIRNWLKEHGGIMDKFLVK